MDLYQKYQPVTWHIGVVNITPDKVVRNIQPIYIPDNKLQGIVYGDGSVEKALESLEPLGPLTKFLLVKTIDGRTVIFGNSFMGVQLPTSYAGDALDVSYCYVRNIPNTISSDQKSGSWGSRVLEFREAGVTFEKPPTFGLHVTNDAGKWHFYRFGEKLPFENEVAYKARRKPDRFTNEMLIEYCCQLGIPVYNNKWYSDKWILIEGKLQPGQKGISYQEATLTFRIGQETG